jgi:hypothetical protein
MGEEFRSGGDWRFLLVRASFQNPIGTHDTRLSYPHEFELVIMLLLPDAELMGRWT